MTSSRPSNPKGARSRHADQGSEPKAPSQSNTGEATAKQRWKYEPDEEPKKKHRWKNPYAGFDESQGHRVGKCPSNIDMKLAEEELNRGVEIPHPDEDHDWPKQIWIVFEGVIYRAVPTNPGKSYHAFPESRERFEQLPRDRRREILARADDLRCKPEVEKWLKRH